MLIKKLLYKFPLNFLRSFSGFNIFWHLLAIALTYLIVTSGLDWAYYQQFATSPLRAYMFSAAIAGLALPFLIPIALYVSARAKANPKMENTALALGQAALMGWLISSLYKVFTGRPGPMEFIWQIQNTDTSHIFRFGFFRGGIFWGWPSSHTAVAFAMSAALAALFPRRKKLKFAAAIYAAYIGVGVSTTIHWFSDFIAGAIIGTVIGIAVGKAFKERLERLNDKRQM